MLFSIIISALGKNLYKIKEWINKDIVDEINEFIIVVQEYQKFKSEIDYLTQLGVRVVFDNGLGLSRSRNIGIKNCNSNYFWILDDDIYTDLDRIKNIIHSINNIESDIYTFRISINKNNLPYKKYFNNKKTSKLFLLKVSSIELVISKKFIDKYNIFFNEDFGLGSIYPMCEETLFLLDCYDSGARIRHIPEFVVIHEESYLRYTNISNRALIAQGYIARRFGIFGFLLILRWYFRMILKYQNFSSFKYLINGYYLEK